MTNGKKTLPSIQLTEILERKIIHGLSLEYDHALLLIPSDFASKMKKPLLRLGSSRHQLGAWHAGKREISISRHFIHSNPWYTIRDVLLHEMAHQMADEVFHAQGESAHGPTFYKACKILRADPKASENHVDFSLKAKKKSLSKQDQLFKRIKKLMALSNSDNSHEAAFALAKAHELILKYNLPLLRDSTAPSTYTTRFLGQPALRHYREDYLLAHLLQEFYFVEGIWVNSYVLEKGKMGRVYEISGTLTNVKIAAYVYDCVCRYIKKKWDSFTSGQKLGRYRKSDFAAGIIVGFHQKLEKERFCQPLPAKENALIVKGDPHLKVYMKERYPVTRNVRSSNASVNTEIYFQGVNQGKQLSLLKGVEANSDSKIYLLKN